MKEVIPFPPEEYQILVGGNFTNRGQELANKILYFIGDKQNNKVLDIGSGCGRVTRYLLDKNIESYVGFDRHKGMVQWCQDNISNEYSNFKFDHFNIASAYDNHTIDTGIDSENEIINALDFKFPYKNSNFTFTSLTSVFTHMPLEEIKHYLKEIYRASKKGGTCLFSVFFTTKESFYNGVANFFHKENEILDILKEIGWEIVETDNPDVNSEIKYTDNDENHQHNWFYVKK